MQSEIRKRLDAIEHRHGMRVLYACESGSRAWGFASEDSDWDVRFIYLHPPEWYLAIDMERRRDVIEEVSGVLDICGWDLRKALWLLHKSNPPLLEWLKSPIVYIDRHNLADRLRAMADVYYSPRACLHHYLHMAEGNFREYLRGERVRTKKYLYVLRPLLALRWIETKDTPPPMPFKTLAGTMLPADGCLREAVNELLTRKQNGDEMGEGPTIPVINAFVEQELKRLAAVATRSGKEMKSSLEQLNRLFREMLGEIWKEV